MFVVIALWCWESSGEFLCYGTHCAPPRVYWLCSSVVVWDRSKGWWESFLSQELDPLFQVLLVFWMQSSIVAPTLHGVGVSSE